MFDFALQLSFRVSDINIYTADVIFSDTLLLEEPPPSAQNVLGVKHRGSTACLVHYNLP